MTVGLYFQGRKVAQMTLDENQRVVTTVLLKEQNLSLQRLLYHGLIAGGKLVLDTDGGIFLEAAIERLTREDGWKAVRED